MVTVEILDPEKNTLSRVLCKLIEESNLSEGTLDSRSHFIKWMKEKHGYTVHFTEERKKLRCHIDTNELFFILKHG